MNFKKGEEMKRLLCAIAILTLPVNMVLAQSTRQAGTQKGKDASANIQTTAASTGGSTSKVAPAGLLPVVLGEGTPGTITKWTGSGLLNSIGNSVMIEDSAGRIGIGTTTPASKLSVRGMIETTLGGYKFPDGTVQTTAAEGGLLSVAHNVTLTGNGTSASPLGIAPGAIGTLYLSNSAVTAAKIANGSVVRSLNGLLDNVQLAGGANITITPSGSALTIAAPNLLSSVAHNSTLTGSGTSSSSLGVAVPLDLAGAVPTDFSTAAVIKVTNTQDRGTALSAVGGSSGSDLGTAGWGIFARGGNGIGGSLVTGGTGVESFGGYGVNGGAGGFGMRAIGGNVEDGSSGRGGDGLQAWGGISIGGNGGAGISVFGGVGGLFGANGSGGDGIVVRGGSGNGTGSGGVGISATGGVANRGGIGNGADGVHATGANGHGAGNSGGTGIRATRGFGVNGASHGLAGDFVGNVNVSGTLSKSSGSFKIDHPLDPENKYLYHSFVESPDMKNIYDGTVTTDENGDATVTLPDYFEALNKDFRYQLTVIGTFAQAIVADEIKDNRFRVKTNAANVKVSWQVTGIRQDAYANKHRIKVEEEKAEPERGFYLHPESFDQPEERGVEWARRPEFMRRMKETSLKQMEETRQKAQIQNR
jgi:hypothetical protein